MLLMWVGSEFQAAGTAISIICGTGNAQSKTSRCPLPLPQFLSPILHPALFYTSLLRRAAIPSYVCNATDRHYILSDACFKVVSVFCKS